MDQPVPVITEADVERIVRRDFGAMDVAAAMAILDEYGRGRYAREPSRVKVAALKLARGDLGALRRHLQDDYRDTLAAAEYPRAFREPRPLHEVPEAERQAISSADWKQYEVWLRRP